MPPILDSAGALVFVSTGTAMLIDGAASDPPPQNDDGDHASLEGIGIVILAAGALLTGSAVYGFSVHAACKPIEERARRSGTTR